LLSAIERAAATAKGKGPSEVMTPDVEPGVVVAAFVIVEVFAFEAPAVDFVVADAVLFA